jgi:hypothetical protein
MVDPGAIPSRISWVAAGVFAARLAAQDDRELRIRSRHRRQYE